MTELILSQDEEVVVRWKDLEGISCIVGPKNMLKYHEELSRANMECYRLREEISRLKRIDRSRGLSDK